VTESPQHAAWCNRPAHEKHLSFAEWLRNAPGRDSGVLTHADKPADAPEPPQRGTEGASTRRSKGPESVIQHSILDYLAAKHIFALRMQTGALKIDQRFVRFGTPGCADILAFPAVCFPKNVRRVWQVVWIECKAAKGRQSDLQKSFQRQVESIGHIYILARSIEDVEDVLLYHEPS